MVHLAIDMPEGMKREFKSLCAKHGDQMSVVLRRAVEDYIASKNRHVVKS